jgi:hypothetical protein
MATDDLHFSDPVDFEVTFANGFDELWGIP